MMSRRKKSPGSLGSDSWVCRKLAENGLEERGAFLVKQTMAGARPRGGQLDGEELFREERRASRSLFLVFHDSDVCAGGELG